MRSSNRGVVALLISCLALIACRGDVLNLPEKASTSKTLSTPEVNTEAEVDAPRAPADDVGQQIPDPHSKTERVGSKSLVLALSWQAGFCEGHEKKSECRSQRADRYDANHFSLHGLWPQPRSAAYCKVGKTNRSRSRRGHWRDLPSVQTSVSTRQRLQKIMPGTRSGLDRHEWIKHGTCYSRRAETYYRDSLALMDAINNSAVQKLFAANIGKYLEGKKIRAAFDNSFGRGTGKRVRIACKRDGKRQLITEITLGLRGVVGPNPNIGKMARKAKSTKPGCPGGIVDEVGLQ